MIKDPKVGGERLPPVPETRSELKSLQEDVQETKIPDALPELDVSAFEQLTPEEVDLIYNSMINEGEGNETFLNYSIRFYTGQDKLDDYQRILLALPNGIEKAITSLLYVFRLDDENTVYKMYESINTLILNPQILEACVSVFINKLNAAQKAAFVAEIGSGIITGSYIVDKLVKFLRLTQAVNLAKSMKTPTQPVNRIPNAHVIKKAASDGLEGYDRLDNFSQPLNNLIPELN